MSFLLLVLSGGVFIKRYNSAVRLKSRVDFVDIPVFVYLNKSLSFQVNKFYVKIDLFNIFKTASLSLSYCSALPSKNGRSLDINVWERNILKSNI